MWWGVVAGWTSAAAVESKKTKVAACRMVINRNVC